MQTITKNKTKEFKKVQFGPKTIKIPNDWGHQNIEELVEFVRGSEPGTDNYCSKNKGIPFYRVGDISSANSGDLTHTNLSDIPTCSEEDILLSLDGSLGIVVRGIEGAFSSGIRKLQLKDKNKLDYDYLFHVLKTKPIQDIINIYSTGTTIKHAGKSTEFIKIPKPPLPEQKKIAEILSTVDEAIEKTDEIIETTKQFKKGLMQDLLTKGVGHDEFKEVQLGPKTEEIPKLWKIEPLSNLVNINMGSSPSSDYYNEDNEGLPFYQGNADFGYISPKPTVWCSEPQKTAEKGNILISVRAPVGELNKSNQKCCIGRGVASIDGEKLVNDFIFYYLKQERQRLESYAQGSTFQSINKSVLESFPVPMPPKEEQKKIASILSSVDEKIQKEQEYKQKLQELKEGLMQDLLTGKVRVNHLID